MAHILISIHRYFIKRAVTSRNGIDTDGSSVTEFSWCWAYVKHGKQITMSSNLSRGTLWKPCLFTPALLCGFWTTLPTWMWIHCTDLRLLPRLFRGTEIPYTAPELARLAKAVAWGGRSSSQEGQAAALHSSATLPAQVSWERRSNRRERKRAAFQ